MRWICWLAANRLASQEGLCTMEWVIYIRHIALVGQDGGLVRCDLLPVLLGWNVSTYRNNCRIVVTLLTKRRLSRRRNIGNLGKHGKVLTPFSLGYILILYSPHTHTHTHTFAGDLFIPDLRSLTALNVRNTGFCVVTSCSSVPCYRSCDSPLFQSQVPWQ